MLEDGLGHVIPVRVHAGPLRAALLTAALLAGCAGIPDVPIPNNRTLRDRVLLAGGGFYARMSTEARLDSETLGIGADVDFEDHLGLDSEVLVPFGMARVRLDDRWRLEVEYFGVDRESTDTLEVEIQWGDFVFPVDTGLASSFELDVLRFSLGYAFFRRKDKELGLALGVHGAKIDATLADASGNSDEGELLAPLPVASLYGGIALTDTWSVNMRVDAFSLEYEEYDGRVLSNGLDLVWQPHRHIGLGVGYRSLLVDLEADDDDFSGRVESDFRGPVAFLSMSF